MRPERDTLESVALENSEVSSANILQVEDISRYIHLKLSFYFEFLCSFPRAESPFLQDNMFWFLSPSHQTLSKTLEISRKTAVTSFWGLNMWIKNNISVTQESARIKLDFQSVNDWSKKLKRQEPFEYFTRYLQASSLVYNLLSNFYFLFYRLEWCCLFS